jgi:hypothetical protein
MLQFAIEFFKRYPLLRTSVAALSFLLGGVSTWIYVGVHVFPSWWVHHYGFMPDLISSPLMLIMAGSGVVFGLCLLSYMPRSLIEISGVELELQPIRKEREEIRQRIEHEAVPNVFDTIQLGLNQITEYYTINKSQARKSFAFSVFAVIMGLSTLIGGVWLFYFGKTPNIQLAALSGIGGLLLQFIGGASFYIYNKSLAQLNYFYDKLIRMQDTMLSIQLCNALENRARQDTIREQLIVEILTRRGHLPAPVVNRENKRASTHEAGKPRSRKSRLADENTETHDKP